MNNKNLWSNLELLRFHDQVKFVIQNFEDYEYAKDVCNRYKLSIKSVKYYFPPVFDVQNPQELVKWILDDKLPVRP